ncbi:MAG: cell division protein ZapA [Clostridia bacterium]|nr:cell division protein ZapA [Clostridia bacterium]
MDEKFDVMVAGTVLTLKGDEEKMKKLAQILNDQVNGILLNDAKSTKLEAALMCALYNLEARLDSEKASGK